MYVYYFRLLPHHTSLTSSILCSAQCFLRMLRSRLLHCTSPLGDIWRMLHLAYNDSRSKFSDSHRDIVLERLLNGFNTSSQHLGSYFVCHVRFTGSGTFLDRNSTEVRLIQREKFWKSACFCVGAWYVEPSLVLNGHIYRLISKEYSILCENQHFK